VWSGWWSGKRTTCRVFESIEAKESMTACVGEGLLESMDLVLPHATQLHRDHPHLCACLPLPRSLSHTTEDEEGSLPLGWTGSMWICSCRSRMNAWSGWWTRKQTTCRVFKSIEAKESTTTHVAEGLLESMDPVLPLRHPAPPRPPLLRTCLPLPRSMSHITEEEEGSLPSSWTNSAWICSCRSLMNAWP
jgi:hypothetical protein